MGFQIKPNLHFSPHLLYRKYIETPQVHHHRNIPQRNFLLSMFPLPSFSSDVFVFKTGHSKVKGDTAPLISWHVSLKADLLYTHQEIPVVVHSPHQSQSSSSSSTFLMLFLKIYLSAKKEWTLT